jgi:hypothetical protein
MLKGVNSRHMKPTQKHRAAIWECMLGTVYAYDGKEVKYFDYDHEGALKFAGVTNDKDPRTYRTDRFAYGKPWGVYDLTGKGDYPSHKKLVLYILK